MPLYYIKRMNNGKSSAKGKWYGHAKYIGTIDDDELAERIEEKCTVHKADVKAVITALVGEMSTVIRDSYRVHLRGLGTFKMGMSTRGAESREKFTTANIKKVRVLFMPETKVDASTKKRTRAMTTGTRFKEWAGEDESSPSTGSNTGSGSSSGSGSGTGGNTGSGGSSGTGITGDGEGGGENV